MIYKEFIDLKLSEMGIGTYLGELDEKTDAGYYETIKAAIEKGVNVIDTAINYRYMKSERVIGKVLSKVGRDKVIVSTKGGYIPYDVDTKIDPRDYFEENFLKTGIVDVKEMTPQGHYLGKEFINWCFNKSLENLKTDYIDIYFLHNPEEQLLYIEREKFNGKIRECFELLEEKVEKGKLRYYGLATWHGFRLTPASRQYLNLKELVEIAESVAGKEHHFKFIQLPYNLGMSEAFTLKNQTVNSNNLSILEAAQELGIYTYISATIYQGNVIGRVPQSLKDFFKLDNDVQVAIQFVRSTPGVGSFLIGMSKIEHLLENLKVLELSPLEREKFLTLFK
ncbi:MAG TPA: aldo/keto reductase [Aquificaceae bacterium]|nr:aldo/keto reductase [Aquificaceae bacterium]HIQ49515.1 aldo/keto reductase [Aquifex aeolicus]